MGYASKFTDEPSDQSDQVGGGKAMMDAAALVVVPAKIRESDVKFEPVTTSHRIGMYTNLRVGKIKFISSKKFGDRQHALIDVLEKCRTRDGEVYDAPYNLWISVDEPFNIVPDMLHKHCLFGFRIYSLRNKDLNGVYNNHLTLKSFEIIADEDAERISMSISDSIKPLIK